MKPDKKKTAVGRETSRKPLDNLSLDVIEAQRLGYGCRYGDYKADHPDTFAARDAAGLFDRHKPQPKGYDLVCAHCGGRFIGKTKDRKFCSDSCKSKANGARYRARHKAKKEGLVNEIII